MFKNKFPGKFIAVEGLSGSGASTQVTFIKDYLNKKGVKNWITEEPTNDVVGGIAKSYLVNNLQNTNPLSLQLLFAADRATHLDKDIRPKLQEGINVITNRYFLSSLAYGAVEISDADWLYQINSQFMLPDLTILLKVPVRVCLQRIKNDNLGLDLFNSAKKLEAVWKNYESVAKRYPNIRIFDGEKKPEEVFAEIQREIDKIIS